MHGKSEPYYSVEKDIYYIVHFVIKINSFTVYLAVWNILDPHTIVPARHIGRPVQVPSGVTSVRRHRAVNIAPRLRVGAVANIGRVVAHYLVKSMNIQIICKFAIERTK